jgi:hypothetical protein
MVEINNIKFNSSTPKHYFESIKSFLKGSYIKKYSALNFSEKFISIIDKK